MAGNGEGPLERPVSDLLPEIGRELDQVAHFGSAGRIKKLVVGAGEALETEDYNGAVDLLVEAKRKAPRSAYVRALLGLAHYGLGQWKEVARELAAYRRLSDRRDRDPIYADAERALGRPEKALEILEGLDQEIVGEEVFVEGLIVAAGALRDLGRHEDAVARLESGPVQPQAVQPQTLRLWYALADALESAGRRRDSRQWWDALYAEDPDFFDVARRRLGTGPSG